MVYGINSNAGRTPEERKRTPMVFTWKTVLFIFTAQLLAYTVKGLIGFGNPLISAPVLSMRLDLL